HRRDKRQERDERNRQRGKQHAARRLSHHRFAAKRLAFPRRFSEHPPPMSARQAAARARRYAVIMAGGVGTRFWPHSRRRRPKQFLAVSGRATLLQETARRARRLVPWARIVVVAPRELAALVWRQLPQPPPANLGVGPATGGTAACLALAAALIARRDRDAAMAVFPADHAIRQAGRFKRSVERGFDIAERENCLVTFGIPPDGPETGYGYIETGARLRSATP